MFKRNKKDTSDLEKAYKQAEDESKMNASEARRQGRDNRAKEYDRQAETLKKTRKHECEDC